MVKDFIQNTGSLMVEIEKPRNCGAFLSKIFKTRRLLYLLLLQSLLQQHHLAPESND
jgi:hypothetical protein